jgi:hypothetical protein
MSLALIKCHNNNNNNTPSSGVPKSNSSDSTPDKSRMINHPAKVSLSFVLENKEVLELFREFLCRELSLEHLMFIEAVKEFQAKYSEKKSSDQWKGFVEDAQALNSDYCDNNSIAPINISSACRDQIQSRVKSLSTQTPGMIEQDLFSQAEKEVVQLLTEDSLMRFKRDSKLIQWIGNRSQAASTDVTISSIPMLD